MSAKTRGDKPRPIHLKDYRSPDYMVDTVELDFQLKPGNTCVKSRLAIRVNRQADGAGGPLRLDGEKIELTSIKLNGKAFGPRAYELTEKALILLKPPKRKFTLEIETTCDPEANRALSGLYRSRGIYCTQCEAQGFRRITYFPDRPDVLSVYTVRVEADRSEAPVLLSNGNPVEAGKVKGTKRHFAVWHDPHPKPCYLFALVGGDLALIRDSFTTMSGREVELRIYVEPGKEDRCAWAMDSLKRSMRWDEERWGREYDLDIFMIVAVSDFNMGAMENKGLNIFNDKLILARPDTATDSDYLNIEAVIAHEYFHNWTGNRITCRDWFQLCLKEGLTVFRDQEFTADEREATVARISDVRMLRNHQFPEDAGPLSHPVRPASYIEINNFYTATVYEKGAEICRMIQTILGRKKFRQGLDLYFARHDGEAATVEQFVKCFEDASGKSLKQFMRWYAQAGTPELAVSCEYDAKKKTATLKVSQVTAPTPGQTKKNLQNIPLKIGLLGPNGHDLSLKTGATGRPKTVKDGVLNITRREHKFIFRDIPKRPVLSLLRGFSAPVNLIANQSDRDLEMLIAHDSDLFNRWQAVQTYAGRLLTGNVKAIRKGANPRSGKNVAGAISQIIASDRLDPAFKALCLALPGEADVARELGSNVDPQAIHDAREALRCDIAGHLRDELKALYGEMASTGPYTPDAASAGRRALRNAALGLLAAGGEKADVARIRKHYSQAGNMTDKIAALSVVSHFDTPARRSLFGDFFENWQEDHLVIDKWFGLQAGSSLPDTLSQVKALMEHPLFSLKKPNKVRALIGMFASFNPTQFNRPDGAGYRLVADTILELDGFNPQIAARLTGAFRSWRTLEKIRRKQARSTLKDIAASPNLSPDTYEIVTRTLG